MSDVLNRRLHEIKKVGADSLADMDKQLADIEEQMALLEKQGHPDPLLRRMTESLRESHRLAVQFVSDVDKKLT
jgi:hypothetical protein